VRCRFLDRIEVSKATYEKVVPLPPRLTPCLARQIMEHGLDVLVIFSKDPMRFPGPAIVPDLCYFWIFRPNIFPSYSVGFGFRFPLFFFHGRRSQGRVAVRPCRRCPRGSLLLRAFLAFVLGSFFSRVLLFAAGSFRPCARLR